MILFEAPTDARSRWLGSAGTIALLHGVVFAAFFVHVPPPSETDASPAMAVDMAPAAMSPPAPKTDDRPTRRQLETPKAQPVRTPRTKAPPFETPPELKIADNKPDVVVPKTSDEKPTSAKPLPPAPDTTAQASPNTTPSKKTTAPMTGGFASGKPTAADIWNNEVVAKIRMVRRYPIAAIALHQEDTVTVLARIDRSGHLQSVHVVDGKGFPMLDNSAMEATRRAAPFPKPPAEVEGDPVEAPIDITYYRRDLMSRK